MTIRSRMWPTAALLAGLAVLTGGAHAADATTPAYLDTHLPPQVRAADLVHRMTLQEKVSQLVNGARAIPRLGVPSYNWWSEALHGVAVDGTTEFPEPVGLGATFDTPGIHEMAHDIGIEGRVVHDKAVHAGGSTIFHGLDFWAPNINIFRDPRWGRGQETYGEDPFLTAHMAVAYVTGMQGSDPRYYLAIATPKHFVVHSGPEPTRHFADVDVSKHDMEDTYLPAFRAAIVEGHAGSIMCAYNGINGQPACANEFTLQYTLRDAWQFQGYVVSDCDAVRDIFNGHRYRPSQPQASAISLERGMDNECADFGEPKDAGDYTPFLTAVQQGYLPESAIDTTLVRLFTARIRLGMFDPPSMVPYDRDSRERARQPGASPARPAPGRGVHGAVEERRRSALEVRQAHCRHRAPRGSDRSSARQLQRHPDAHGVPARRHESRLPQGHDHLRSRHAVPGQPGHPDAGRGVRRRA